VRKEPKGHGTQTWVEGRANLPPGSPVAIEEDTTTTGGSLLKAVDRAEADGLRVVQCFTVVDREEGAAEALAARGFVLEALVRRAELESA
jgi:orotate phosphoribosyltransferase